MIKKNINIVFIVVVMLCITLPLVLSDKEGGQPAMNELRYLARFPKLKDNTLNDFFAGFNLWIDDNAGGRNLAIKLDTLLQYHLFGVGSRKNTFISENNWIYYYTDEILRDYQQYPLSDGERAAINEKANALISLKNALDTKEIPFLGVLIPDKKTVYPENYMQTVLKVSDTSQSDELMRALGGAKWYINLKDRLVQAKVDATVYSPRIDDAHWNSYGAFVGYLGIMAALEQYNLGQKKLSFDDFNITEFTQQSMYNGIIPIEEKNYTFELKNPNEIVEEPAFFAALPQLGYAGSGPNDAKRYLNSDKSLPKLLLVGDSYAEVLRKYLVQSFSELTFINIGDGAQIMSVVEACNPDIVLYENVERMGSLVKSCNPLVN